MTIHKAKGLEFDMVILPALGSLPRSEDQRLLITLEQHRELLLAPISESGAERDPIYKYLSRMERRRVELETARLLYVAVTRARESLHLLGSLQVQDDGSIAEPGKGSFLKLLWPTVSQAFANLSQPIDSDQPKQARAFRRVALDWKTPEPRPAVAESQRQLEMLEAPRVTFNWASDRLRHAGTALHGFLQRIAREGLAGWDESSVRGHRDVYRSVLSNLGVAPADLRETVSRVESGLLRTLRDPRGQWILARHSDAENEAPIAGLIDGKLVETTIDRTFIDENGVRWIIDYKTSEHEGGDVEAFLDNERTRYQEQLERYARLLIQRDHRPIRLGLYFPMLGGWREWAAPVVLRKQATLFEL